MKNHYSWRVGPNQFYQHCHIHAGRGESLPRLRGSRCILLILSHPRGASRAPFGELSKCPWEFGCWDLPHIWNSIGKSLDWNCLRLRTKLSAWRDQLYPSIAVFLEIKCWTCGRHLVESPLQARGVDWAARVGLLEALELRRSWTEIMGYWRHCSHQGEQDKGGGASLQGISDEPMKKLSPHPNPLFISLPSL